MPKRTNLAIDSKLYEKLTKVAKKEGRTIFSLSNYIFAVFLNAAEKGISIDEIRAQCELKTLLNELDLVILPRKMIIHFIKELGLEKSEKLRKLFFEQGREIGDYLRVRGETFEEILLKARLVYSSIGLKNLRVKVLNPYEFLIFVSSDMKDEDLTKLGCEFIKGFAYSFGYNVVKTETTKDAASLRVVSVLRGQWFR